MLMNSNEYLETIETIKQEIRLAQYQATVSVNRELLLLYHSIGEVINAHKTWGSKFIENLSADIKLSFPDAKGYSVRNLKYMAKFALLYPDKQFVQTVSAQIRGPIMWPLWTRYLIPSRDFGISPRQQKMAGHTAY